MASQGSGAVDHGRASRERTGPGGEEVGRRYGAKTAPQRRAERRDRLLAAGLELYGTVGYRATTIEALCTAAAVSTRTFYEEFGSRDALLIALHDDLIDRVTDAVLAALAAHDPADIVGRIHAATTAYFDVMTSDRRWAQIALVETVGVSAEIEGLRRAAVDRFVALVESEADRLADAGLIEPRDHHLTAVAVTGAVNGLVNTWTANPDWEATVPRIAEEATRVIWLAITCGRGQPRLSG